GEPPPLSAAAPRAPLRRPGALAARLGARSRVEGALGQLPVEARVVFVLSELEEMPLARIANRLGVPEGTVASRLRRARTILGEWAARNAAAAAFEQARPESLGALGARRDDLSPRDPEILSWWVSRGESEALRALISVYRRSHPNASVVSAAVSGTPIARRELRSRMTRGRPPDTFQVNGGTDLFSWIGSGAFRERM